MVLSESKDQWLWTDNPDVAAPTLTVEEEQPGIVQDTEPAAPAQSAAPVQPSLAGLMQAEMEQGNYKAAALLGVRLVKAEPRWYEAWFNLGLCYHHTHHTEQAAQAYTEAVSVQPDGTAAHCNLAAILHKHGDLAAARGEYERVLKLQPDHRTALWNLATLEEREGHLDRAEETYVLLLRQGKDVFGPAFRLGRIRLEREDFAGATDAFQTCLRERSGDVESGINLAVAHWRSGDSQAAATIVREVSSGNPDCVAALRLEATLAVEVQDWRTAQRLERKLSELGEDTSTLVYNIGVLQRSEALHSEAISAFQKASAERPGFAEALVNAGYALRETGQMEQAVDAWKAALEAQPELAHRYFARSAASVAS